MGSMSSATDVTQPALFAVDLDPAAPEHQSVTSRDVHEPVPPAREEIRCPVCGRFMPANAWLGRKCPLLTGNDEDSWEHQ